MQSSLEGYTSQCTMALFLCLQWITNPFWFRDPDFLGNLRVEHGTFLLIVELVAPTVLDSLYHLSGSVWQSKEFKVAVVLYHLGHGGTWRMTANTCGIGVSTAKLYVQHFSAAVITHGKPLYSQVQTDCCK